ncbi:sulfotransferase family protein [Halochromatium glycolicum]|uniref:Sulfotransferase family protein n=1 Tax=Halochromatium glycolicum TaxID=85075 RepID=A0AAJ0U8F4_9GAMM|nr:sulfotransferase [Halochromatium glycolicum]MBK1706377.1 hypothetical protein [Halochromatium glycolicum]
MSDCLARPIFVIGMPRSGTTLVFERLAGIPGLGWLSNYSEMAPGQPWLNILRPLLGSRLLRLEGRKRQYGRTLPGNRYLPQPVEAYAFWDRWAHPDFSTDFLVGQSADRARREATRDAVRRTLRWQRRERLITKITGPGRIAFLTSIFPDARFVHVIRDGRPVVDSLLRVGFWVAKGGLERPFWRGGLDPAVLDDWRLHGSRPAELAALQWLHVIRGTRAEAGALPAEQYVELRYEDFIDDQAGQLNRLAGLLDLPGAGLVDERSRAREDARARMNEKYRDHLDPETIQRITRIMGPLLSELHYV